MDNILHRTFKDRLYDQFGRIGRALASPRRLEILDLLAQCERGVEEMAIETGMSVANTSQHLQVLRAAQLVEVRRQGLYMYYRLADESVFRVWQAIRDLGEKRLAEIDRIVRTFIHEREELEPVTAEELLADLLDGTVIVLDVRPEEEYRAGHIPGALSVPIKELETRLGDIPKDKDIVAYCRGPYCMFSDEAVSVLRAHGYKVRRLSQGLPDWRAAGLSIEKN